ncbi:outer membrane protein [Congregicoccus parvus]|uniref:outer membrane protein n=1 Tax=Congregicoccus parvus TaxID=3081749 RepID=UPI003FA5B11C
MRLPSLLAVLVMLVSVVAASGQTVADRLRELDRLKAEGILSEAVYEQQWNKVLEDAIKTPPPAPAGRVSVPKLPRPAPEYKYELLLSGSWLSLDAGGSDTSMLNVGARLGQHFARNWTAIVGVDHLDAEIDGTDLNATGLSAGVDFNFGSTSAAFVPYVGAGVSWMKIDVSGVDDDDWAWEVRGGLRHYVGDRVVLKYQVAYQKFNDIDLDGVTATIGIGLRF